MEIVQLDEPTMIRCKFGIGADHVKDGKLDKGEIAKELKTQINNVNALKMDANIQDKYQHGNMQLCTKGVIWGLFEVISPGIVMYQYQSLYREKVNDYISNEANFVTKPEHECHWLPGKYFHLNLDEHRINPQLTLQKVLDIQIPDESENNPALLELSLNLVKLWTENLADLWDRNNFIAAQNLLKHPSITALKYDGIDALQKSLTEGLCKKT